MHLFLKSTYLQFYNRSDNEFRDTDWFSFANEYTGVFWLTGYFGDGEGTDGVGDGDGDGRGVGEFNEGDGTGGRAGGRAGGID